MRIMKLSLLVLIVLTATKTKAQVKDNLSLGPIVGFGHSWNNAGLSTGIERKFKPSLNVGGRLVYSASSKLGIGLDATFRTEGNKLETTTSENKLNLNYLRLDPKLLYFFGNYGQAFRPKIGVGSSFGFLIGGTSKIFGGTTYKSKDFYKAIDFSLSGMLGFNYQLKSKT